MKTKKLTPRNAAPVQRENTATVARDFGAIAPRFGGFLSSEDFREWYRNPLSPFAGDDAE